MIIIGDDGNNVAYFLMYVDMCFPCAPVHVVRRIRDGADTPLHPESLLNPSQVHMDGAIGWTPGIVSCIVVHLDIVTSMNSRDCK